MRILVTGVAGFVGSQLARFFSTHLQDVRLYGLDNLRRSGSYLNLAELDRLGIDVIHGDLRLPSDFELLPEVDWVVDAAAEPSALAGRDGRCSSRQLVENNLVGTLNLLEYCRVRQAGIVLLSTSRVYSLRDLGELPLVEQENRFLLDPGQPLPDGVTSSGITERFSTASPISMYGATKLASETLALEYGEAYGFPVWVNRCGVLAGSGQFGRPDQGIFSYWIHSWRENAALEYFGFDGRGLQVRDCLHPDDLGTLLLMQLNDSSRSRQPVQNVAGGTSNAISLSQLSHWCSQRYGKKTILSGGEDRLYDVPWLVLDCQRAEQQWDWRPERGLVSILEEISKFADDHPDWLSLTKR